MSKFAFNGLSLQCAN